MITLLREVVAPATLAELAAIVLFLAMIAVWAAIGSGTM